MTKLVCHEHCVSSSQDILISDSGVALVASAQGGSMFTCWEKAGRTHTGQGDASPAVTTDAAGMTPPSPEQRGAALNCLSTCAEGSLASRLGPWRAERNTRLGKPVWGALVCTPSKTVCPGSLLPPPLSSPHTMPPLSEVKQEIPPSPQHQGPN